MGSALSIFLGTQTVTADLKLTFPLQDRPDEKAQKNAAMLWRTLGKKQEI